MKLTVKNMLPQSDESYEDFLIRMEGVWNKVEDAKKYTKKLEDLITGIKSFGYNVIIMGDKVKLTLNSADY